MPVASHLRRLSFLRNAIGEAAPELVIAHQDYVAILVLISLVGRPDAPPVVVVEHADPASFPEPRYLRVLRRITYPRAQAVVELTEEGAEWWRPRLDRPVFVVPNSVPGLAEPPTGGDRPIDILAAGRMEPRKGFDRLLAAVRQMPRFDDLRVVIAGDGPEWAALRRLVDDSGLGHVVELAGRRTDMVELYSQTKVFALPSRSECHPLVLLEAMAMGCAPVAFDCRTGPGEIIRHGVDGLLVKAGDVDGFAAALDRLLTDDELRCRLAREAIGVRHRFSADVDAERWRDVRRLVVA